LGMSSFPSGRSATRWDVVSFEERSNLSDFLSGPFGEWNSWLILCFYLPGSLHSKQEGSSISHAPTIFYCDPGGSKKLQNTLPPKQGVLMICEECLSQQLEASEVSGESWQPVTVIDGEGDTVCESHIVLVMYKFVLFNMCSYCILAKHQANSPSSWN
jgi:hypothetical protein